MHYVFWISLIGLLFPHVIYPWTMKFLASANPRQKNVDDREHEAPRVALIISAYNEADYIAAKLQNALALDYPQDKLQVVVISDASTDGTDQLVNRFPSVGLFRQQKRAGKSAGLTEFIPQISADLLVFTDANALFRQDALRHLVRPFCDPSVGYVVGAQQYHDDLRYPSAQSETIYWRRELQIKAWESQVSSVVGGDGAIYALRRELFLPLQDSDVSDLLLPLQAVTRGYRGVFEPQAVCYEYAAQTFRGQFWRKTRIISRSLRTVFQCHQALNVFRVGIFAYQLFAHKLLRWFSPLFFSATVGASLFLAAGSNTFYQVVLAVEVIMALAAILYVFPSLRGYKAVYLPYYFFLINAAACTAILALVGGWSFATWTPDRNQHQ